MDPTCEFSWFYVWMVVMGMCACVHTQFLSAWRYFSQLRWEVKSGAPCETHLEACPSWGDREMERYYYGYDFGPKSISLDRYNHWFRGLEVYRFLKLTFLIVIKKSLHFLWNSIQRWVWIRLVWNSSGSLSGLNECDGVGLMIRWAPCSAKIVTSHASL